MLLLNPLRTGMSSSIRRILWFIVKPHVLVRYPEAGEVAIVLKECGISAVDSIIGGCEPLPVQGNYFPTNWRNMSSFPAPGLKRKRPRYTAMFRTWQISAAYRGWRYIGKKNNIKEIGTNQKLTVYRVRRYIQPRSQCRMSYWGRTFAGGINHERGNAPPPRPFLATDPVISFDCSNLQQLYCNQTR